MTDGTPPFPVTPSYEDSAASKARLPVSGHRRPGPFPTPAYPPLPHPHLTPDWKTILSRVPPSHPRPRQRRGLRGPRPADPNLAADGPSHATPRPAPSPSWVEWAISCETTQAASAGDPPPFGNGSRRGPQNAAPPLVGETSLFATQVPTHDVLAAARCLQDPRRRRRGSASAARPGGEVANLPAKSGPARRAGAEMGGHVPAEGVTPKGK